MDVDVCIPTKPNTTRTLCSEWNPSTLVNSRSPSIAEANNPIEAIIPRELVVDIVESVRVNRPGVSDTPTLTNSLPNISQVALVRAQHNKIIWGFTGGKSNLDYGIWPSALMRCTVALALAIVSSGVQCWAFCSW